ncbi:MAG TPA: methyltransferase domain-containing protein [Actinomycetota bacterium]|nr:methyltransferase domain-containing protein [Actinomycetota bacterium]
MTTAPTSLPSVDDGELTELDAKTRNILYHDWEATQYDDKWSISFDERCISYAKEKFTKVAPERKYGKVLEIGCGTGFFIVNLWQAGLVRQAFATDISPGMVEVCQRNARLVGLKNLEGRAADAETLPYKTGTFDLVVGHAVLHHVPDVPAALAECYRVLKPGGALVIAGEPTRIGHAVNKLARRATATAFKAVGRVRPGLLNPDRSVTGHDDPAAALEKHVDLHEFHPHMVERWLQDTGFGPLRIRTEEFISGFFGWSVRTIEALSAPGLLGEKWAWWAYRNYLRLYRMDDTITRRLVPKPLFYNLLFYAEKPSAER